ncbi:laminin G domain protein [Dictyocaulus viviparus]|uniref:Laminin G domain protein n=1 Tax=Dictyocaulus viviparus TaxID=29172 RepID=A0A0D8Y5H5_DICVI|nr:laminin G domain protein [Dictyocaulus viviparus]
MKVDRQSWVELQLVSIDSRSTKPGMLYIGGSDDHQPPLFTSSSGFHGCVKKIRLNGRSIVLRTGSNENVRECGTNPCISAGCPEKCISNNKQDFLCLCEWPTYGRTCEIKAKRLSGMRFSGYSYLELKTEDYMKQIIGDSLRLEMNLKIENSTDVNDKSSKSSQLLAFAGENGVNSDFLRLLLTEDHLVQVMMNLGSSLVSLTHPTRLISGTWTRIGVEKPSANSIHKRRQPHHNECFPKNRTLNILKGIHIGESATTFSLQCTQDRDSSTKPCSQEEPSANSIHKRRQPITTSASRKTETLNLLKGIHIGGMPSNIQHVDGFKGCIDYFRIGSLLIDHPQMATKAINIENCD